MQEEVQKIKKERIDEHKQVQLRDIADHELHLDFREAQYEAKKKEAKSKEDKERLAHWRLQIITPLKDKIEEKTNYYNWLCQKESSATASVEEKQTDTSEQR